MEPFSAKIDETQSTVATLESGLLHLCQKNEDLESQIAKVMESQIAKVMEPLSAKIDETQSTVATLTEEVKECKSRLLDLTRKREDVNRRKAESRVQQGLTRHSTAHAGVLPLPNDADIDEASIDEDAPDASLGSSHDAITEDPALNTVLMRKAHLKNAELAVTQKAL